MMIRKVLWLGVATLCLALFVSPSSAAIKSIRINETAYVPLSEWAKANNLRWNWVRSNKTLYVTNRTSRLLFIAESREARINNVEVWLSFPVLNRYGRFFVSQIDVDCTLGPVLFPQRNNAGNKIRNICIDPGHGGKDPGNRVGSQNEKEYTLRLASELRSQLRKAGFNVYLTRSGNSFIDLSERPAIAKRRNADLFISVHFNAVASGRDQVKGAETYVLTPAGARSTAGGGEIAEASPGNRFDEKNVLLAYEIQRNLVDRLSAEDRGVRRARFQVLRESTLPAVLIEGGYMSHPDERKKIFDAAYRREMAKGIVEGILSYKRIVERPD